MKLCSDKGRRLTVHVVLMLALLFAASVQAQGIDVSKYQGKINWTKVSKSKKVKFVYIRATEGASIRDSYYKNNIDGARKAGILVGSYHVYSSKTTAYQQFANFKAVAVKKKQDLIPVLDIDGHQLLGYTFAYSDKQGKTVDCSYYVEKREGRGIFYPENLRSPKF